MIAVFITVLIRVFWFHFKLRKRLQMISKTILLALISVHLFVIDWLYSKLAKGGKTWQKGVSESGPPMHFTKDSKKPATGVRNFKEVSFQGLRFLEVLFPDH